MIQFTFDSIAKVVPEWEREQERLTFRLVLASVCRSEALHARMDAAGVRGPDLDAVGMVALHYDGDLARQVRVMLELPEDVWQDLANRADDLLEESHEEA
jgi:hypothetical protein